MISYMYAQMVVQIVLHKIHLNTTSPHCTVFINKITVLLSIYTNVHVVAALTETLGSQLKTEKPYSLRLSILMLHSVDEYQQPSAEESFICRLHFIKKRCVYEHKITSLLCDHMAVT